MNIDVTITSYRRPELAVAAIRSCLAQGPSLARVVVVDDASGDDTPARIGALGDSRVTLHVRSANGGIGAARADGLARCSAEWTVMLDSDHELLPGALQILAERAATVPPQVGVIGARFLWDTGRITPERLPPEPIDYAGRIAWSTLPDSIGTDYLCCISRRVRESVCWATERSGLVDALFQLDAARIADAVFLPDCLGYQKSNAPEGYSRGSVSHLLASRRRDAPGGVAVCRKILERHGPGLRAHGPARLVQVLKEGATFAALTGDRLLGARWAAEALAIGGPALVPPGLVLACLAGPNLFSWAYRKRLIRGGATP